MDSCREGWRAQDPGGLNDVQFAICTQIIVTAAIIGALAGCGGGGGQTHTTTSQTSQHYSAAEKRACQQLDAAASTLPQMAQTMTTQGLGPYSRAVSSLAATVYGPGGDLVMPALKHVTALGAQLITGAPTDQAVAQVDRDAASLGTFCGQVLSSG